MNKLAKTIRLISSQTLGVRRCCADSKFKKLCGNYESIQINRLSNGIRVACECCSAQTVTLGIFFLAGSRYEIPYNNGIAHFLEHMLLKGTALRPQLVLEKELASMGVFIDAYTTREEIGFHATCLPSNVEDVMGIFAEIILKPCFDECEVENEKKIIFQEVEDLQKDSIYVAQDLLHSTAFQGTPLGNTVLGPTSNIHKFLHSDLYFYLCSNLDTCKMVIAAAGCLTSDKLLKLSEKYFCSMAPVVTACPKPPICRFTGSEVRYRDDNMPLATVSIAVEGVGWDSRDKLALDVASKVMGSWSKQQGGGRNNASHLAQCASVEDMCYYFDSYNICYKDTGLWGIVFICESLDLDDFLSNIQDQWMKMSVSITESEVNRAKYGLFTENMAKTGTTAALCKDIGHQVLMTDRWTSPADMEMAIYDVNDLRHTMFKYLYDKCPAVAAVGPVEGLPDYTRIRAGMYWLRY